MGRSRFPAARAPAKQVAVYDLQLVSCNQSSDNFTNKRALTVTEMLTSALHTARIGVRSE